MDTLIDQDVDHNADSPNLNQGNVGALANEVYVLWVLLFILGVGTHMQSWLSNEQQV